MSVTWSGSTPHVNLYRVRLLGPYSELGPLYIVVLPYLLLQLGLAPEWENPNPKVLPLDTTIGEGTKVTLVHNSSHF